MHACMHACCFFLALQLTTACLDTYIHPYHFICWIEVGDGKVVKDPEGYATAHHGHSHATFILLIIMVKCEIISMNLPASILLNSFSGTGRRPTQIELLVILLYNKGQVPHGILPIFCDHIQRLKKQRPLQNCMCRVNKMSNIESLLMLPL